MLVAGLPLTLTATMTAKNVRSSTSKRAQGMDPYVGRVSRLDVFKLSAVISLLEYAQHRAERLLSRVAIL